MRAIENLGFMILKDLLILKKDLNVKNQNLRYEVALLHLQKYLTVIFNNFTLLTLMFLF